MADNILRRIKVIDTEGKVSTYQFGADSKDISYNDATVKDFLDQLGPDAGAAAIEEMFEENNPSVTEEEEE